jgi:hypothetical protein
MSQSYPVFIEETSLKLVWIDADNAEQAQRWASETPWEYGKNAEVCDGWHSATAPSPDAPYDWDAVYGYDGAAEEQDQHVQLHRAHEFRLKLQAKQAACHEARHPDVEVYWTGSIWCRGCTDYLYIADEERSS